MSEEEKGKGFDIFELCVALLLGFAALGAALAGLQAGQWGGKQLDAFAEANALTTKAAKSYSEAVSAMNSDFSVVGEAKKLIIEGIYAETDAAQEKSYMLASYYLTRQLNADAYEALGLPQDLFAADEGDTAAADPNKPADGAAAPASSKPAPKTEEEMESEMSVLIPEEALLAVLDTELDDDDTYENAMFEEGTQLFAEADKKFAEGRLANDNGDKFDLAGVFYTVALFFAGLGLVFKSNARWGFFWVGVIVFLGTSGYLATLPWAG